MIKKIKSLKGLGLYNGNEAFTDINDFKKFNIFYGCNGSGKTSLSRAFRFLEQKELPVSLKLDNPTVEFSINDECGNKTFNNSNVNDYTDKIKVFNTDYIKENIDFSSNRTNGIVIIGASAGANKSLLESKKIEQDKTLKTLNGGIHIAMDESEHDFEEGLKKDLANKNKEKAGFLQTGAKTAVFDSGWYNQSNTFNAGHLERAILALTDSDVALDDEELKTYTQQATLKDAPEQINFDVFNNPFSMLNENELLEESLSLLQKCVSSTEIPRLKDKEGLEAWVKSGRDNHYFKKGGDCPICTSTIPDPVWNEFESFFTNEKDEFEKQIKKNIQDWDTLCKSLPLYPSKETWYQGVYKEDLKSSYESACKAIVDKPGFVYNVVAALSEKLKSTDKVISHDIDKKKIEECFSQLHSIAQSIGVEIRLNNQECTNHQSNKNNAEKALVKNVALTYKPKYDQFCADIKQLSDSISALETQLGVIEGEISTLEQSLSDYGKAVPQINQHLKSYLGHERFKLDISDKNEYLIKRNDVISHAPLSEGEQTALALCYFAVCLENCEDYKNGDLIIVFDDPISSLDNQHLHYAFSFMNKLVRKAKQAFILTHNFYFFKEAQKNIFNKKNKDGECVSTLINLVIKGDSSRKYPKLVAMPKSLTGHESEYHYIMSKLIETSESGYDWDNAELYALANYCRRALESFAYFKVPNQNKLIPRLEIIINEIKNPKFELIKLKAQSRLNDLGSHGDNLDKVLGFDDVTLSSIKDGVELTLSLIEHADSTHFKHLKNGI